MSTSRSARRVPLSAAQTSIWVAHHLDPSGCRHNIADYVEIDGDFQVSIAERAWQQLFEETELLRTGFIEDASGRWQIIDDASSPQMTVIDFTRHDIPEREAEAWMNADLATAVSLTENRLYTLALLKVGPSRYFWYYRCHHILLDGYSGALLWLRIASIYTELSEGRDCGLQSFHAPEELLRDEEDYRSSESFSKDRVFFRDYVRGAAAAVRLPGNPSSSDRPFLRCTTFLPPVECGQIHRIAALGETGWTRIIISALAGYFHDLTGQKDMIIGLPVTARLAELAKVTPGMRSNIVPLRLVIDAEESFLDLVDTVRREIRTVVPHQQYRYEDLRRDLGMTGSQEDILGPMINVMPFRYDIRFGECRVVSRNLSNGPVEYMSVAVRDRSGDGGLQVDWDGNPGFFGEEDLRSLAQGFLEFLQATLAQADGTGGLRRTPVRPGREPEQNMGGSRDQLPTGLGREDPDLERVLVEWNDTAHPIPSFESLSEAFEAQVEASPESVALAFGDSSLTYRQLNSRANQLAHRLVRMGAGVETPVALLFERCPDLVVAILAVVKTGATYVPIHSSYPSDLMSWVMEDTGAAILLTHHAMAGRQFEHAARVVIVDADPDSKAEPTSNLRVRGCADQLAYVMYTSGSTGLPKGVAVRHRDVLHLAFDRCWQGGAHERVLMHSPYAFDASTYELWIPLLGGGLIVMAPPGDLECSTLSRLIEQQGITGLLVTAGLFSLMVAEDPSCFAGVRQLCTGGDVVSPIVVRRVMDACRGTQVVNCYGPTEITLSATSYLVESATDLTDQVPIGKPLDNTRVYVLDAFLRLVPVGVEGELFIAGAGLARGYLNRPALTAERFVADPFGPPGSRMYRTGDVVRWRADGNLEFVGRTDQQVKVRGFRIEPGQIEAALAEHPVVRQAVVLARQDGPGEKTLVGYIMVNDGVTAGARALSTEVREFLRSRVPDYMVPAAVVVMERFPLTLNGKLDRAALPAPDFNTTVGVDESLTPREEILHGLVAEVLELQHLGINDGFFDLGGDSLLAMELVARAGREGLVLSLRDVFEQQTVRQMAAAAGAGHHDSGNPGERLDDGTGPVALTPIMAWLRDSGIPCQTFHQSIVVQVPPELDARLLTGSLQAVVDHHDMLRARLTREDDERWSLATAPKGTADAATLLAYRSIEGLAQDERRSTIARQATESMQELDPEAGRMLRATWLDAGRNQPGLLLLVAHHLVVDGVSWRIIRADLASAYSALAARKPIDLAPVGTSFRSWAQHLTRAALEPALAAELPLWTSILAAKDRPLGDRPLDPTRDTAANRRKATLTLSSSLTAALLTAAPAAFDSRPNEVILAAFALAVTEWRARGCGSPATAFLIDLEGHGRQESIAGAELSRTVGWFTALFPARLDTGPVQWSKISGTGPEIGSAVLRITQQVRALPDGGVGYGLLRYLNPQTAPVLAEHPSPEILFNYLGRVTATGQDWTIAPETLILPDGRALRTAVSHGLEINAIIYDRTDGPELHATLSWPRNWVSDQRAHELIALWREALTAIASCTTQRTENQE
ncbi:non-ribosomal peptide synthetase [Streptomyces spongiae]|uniref:non-ribosomal peptide synthetase n=1 Tax=Streptomyces spongiae TaxID=565072 RepID=UPI001883C091|nr:non-ribosomal peptide synthetase [Streptomyces spongiae]